MIDPCIRGDGKALYYGEPSRERTASFIIRGDGLPQRPQTSASVALTEALNDYPYTE